MSADNLIPASVSPSPEYIFKPSCPRLRFLLLLKDFLLPNCKKSFECSILVTVF
jgi:hypothetical protein